MWINWDEIEGLKKSKQYDGSKLEQSTNVERHVEVGHQRFFKDDSNDSTTYNDNCFRKWFTMRRGLCLHLMDLIYALDLFFIQKLGFVGTLGLSYIQN
jgi:hypothetical protein